MGLPAMVDDNDPFPRTCRNLLGARRAVLQSTVERQRTLNLPLENLRRCCPDNFTLPTPPHENFSGAFAGTPPPSIPAAAPRRNAAFRAFGVFCGHSLPAT